MGIRIGLRFFLRHWGFGCGIQDFGVKLRIVGAYDGMWGLADHNGSRPHPELTEQ